VAWPPTAEEFYLGDPGPRAMFQGDVYERVPFTKAAQGNGVDADPSWSARRMHVALLLHPCYIVGSDGYTPVKAQPIAAVYEARSKHLAIPDDWEGVFGICPLPDLLGDGEMWVCDFRSISVVDRSYLPRDRRVRSLSELGWAIFRQRYITAATRGALDVKDLIEVGTTTWTESEMETRWQRADRALADFHKWLDAADPSTPEVSRRDVLDDAPEAVLAWLEAELATSSD
jgi:hypothetical protein